MTAIPHPTISQQCYPPIMGYSTSHSQHAQETSYLVADFYQKHPGVARQIRSIEFQSIPFRSTEVPRCHFLKGGGCNGTPINTPQLCLHPPTQMTWLDMSLVAFICLSVCFSVHLSVHLSIHLFVHLSVCLSVCLSICLSVHLFVCPFVHLFVRPSVRTIALPALPALPAVAIAVAAAAAIA